MSSRFVVFVALVVVSSCNCPGRITGTPSEPFRFSSAPIQFEDTPLGVTRTIVLEVTNVARVSRTASAELAAPFSVPETLTIEPGGVGSLSISFTPTQVGAANAVLRFDGVAIDVSGVGTEARVCGGSVCSPERFDATLLMCVAQPLPDGAACEGRCVERGQCQAGQCVTSGDGCDDGNQCTIDACDPDGCVHLDRECPMSSDPCQVPSCDSTNGCGFREADDGTVCGAESCAETQVRVCISGQCVARTRPDTARCSNTWVPLVIPTLWSARIAHDAVRGKLVALIASQTWSWDGTQWSQLFPPASPPDETFELATDTHRRRVVVHTAGQTWEWDGSTWLKRAEASANAPGERLGPAMAYDAKRRRVVLFGGSGLMGHSNDTWEWDGARWERRTSAHVPIRRAFATLGWDAAREKIVLFGGADDSFNKLNDTWEWDGTDWALRAFAVTPPARFGATFTWDPIHQSLTLVGGTLQSALRDVWDFNGTSWVERGSDDIAVSGHGAAWDPSRERLVVFSLGGTWEWDGSTWASRRHVAPNPRRNMSMVFDATRRKTLLFGGHASPLVRTEALDDFWAHDTAWAVLPMTPKPSPRHLAGFAWDALRQRAVLFGGTSEFGSPSGTVGERFNDTWEWDGTAWTQRMPATSPATGAVSSATWDEVRQRVVMLTTNDGTWEWDGANWSQRVPVSPVTSWGSSMAFDRTSQRVLMVTNNKTFALDGAAWALLSPPDALPANVTDGRLAWDEAQQRLVLHAQAGTYAWNGATWTNLQPTAKPFSGPQALVFDGVTQRITSYTGDDEWAYLP